VTRVKVCGISRVDHALAAAKAGADFIGLVFAPSRRQVRLEEAREIALAVREFGPGPLLVGVFVNIPAAQVNHISEYCGLDYVQLSGDEPWGYCAQVALPLIKAVRVARGEDMKKVLADLRCGREELGGRGFLCLLDSHVPGEYGGSGQTFDWTVAAEVSRSFTTILAGGLTPQNVGEAIKIAQPWGVDVSSGVETADTKDVSKIRAFVEAVRKVDADA